MMPTSSPVSPNNPFRPNAADRTDGQSISRDLVPQSSHLQSTALQPIPSRPVAQHANTKPSSRVTSPAPALQHMPNSYPPPGETHNYNNSEGVFNQVNGDQRFDYNMAHNGHIYEGDTFAAPIHGGNVGGRNNQNAIYNGSAAVGPPRRYGGNTNMRVLQTKADALQSEIDQLMEELGLDEEQKLERKIFDLQLTLRALQREVQLRPQRPESAPSHDVGYA
ncbi:hypothetical protein CCMSSC00406_0006132 [Pleurotus cornucopiae]|uniref:Uncharacterized protein n=1 Tax=Pleurotus cornucopiae TaxID=5321 RepID=A0ACB7J7V9_PLECO|nr:hypothetical protein CCMSSC00406_0006132 [Pleurotus cornucopiae]